eukprot:m.15065 g.15065  ORF g.15065 m.15065 type:complete len:199 (-) comp10409_c0_seq1:292-888(-)
MADTTVVQPEPGPRATVLHQAFAKALAKVEETTSWQRIVKKYPELLPKKLDFLKQLYSQYMSKVQECTKEEFQLILQDNEVVQALNKLDAAIEELGADNVDTPHSRPLENSSDMPQVALQARVDAKQAEKARLQAELLQLQEESQALEASIQQAQKSPQPIATDDGSTLAKAASTFEAEMHPARVAKLESFAVTLGES